MAMPLTATVPVKPIAESISHPVARLRMWSRFTGAISP
jgi:hypothetical protein